MKIKDVRFEAIFFSEDVKTSLNRVLSDIGHNYLSKIKYQFEIDETHILLFHVGNIDDKKYEPKEYYILGKKETGNIGQTSFYFSESLILSFDDSQKRHYLLNIFHKAIKNYANNFNESGLLLEQAYSILLQEGFYRNSTGYIFSPNKLFKCWIEKLLNFNDADYRLAFEILNTKIIQYCYIANKKNMMIAPNSDIKILLTTPQNFHVEGWKKNEFRFRWGEYGNELYIFNITTKTLKKEIDEIELPEFLK